MAEQPLSDIRRPTAYAKSCQGCHMEQTYEGEPISTLIASIQDSSYPETEHMIPVLKIAEARVTRETSDGWAERPAAPDVPQVLAILCVSKAHHMSRAGYRAWHAVGATRHRAALPFDEQFSSSAHAD